MADGDARPMALGRGTGREPSQGGNGVPSYRQGKCRPFNIPLCKPARDINVMREITPKRYRDSSYSYSIHTGQRKVPCLSTFGQPQFIRLETARAVGRVNAPTHSTTNAKYPAHARATLARVFGEGEGGWANGCGRAGCGVEFLNLSF